MTASDTGATVAFEQSLDIIIATPSSVVLDYVSNPKSWPEWMPATHEITCPDRPLQAGETFSERWATRKGEVGLEWQVTERVQPSLWVAETKTDFTGPIVARYEVEELGPTTCRYTRRIINPARPKAPTTAMVQRMTDEAAECLANIKNRLESSN